MATPIFDNVTLTGTPDDNVAEFDVKNVSAISIHVVYTKGTENHSHILVQFSTTRDDNGAEVWSDWADINQVGGVDHHLIESDPFKIVDTGNYRITPIPISRREDKIRLKVWADSPGATPGTHTVFLVADKQTA
jgi:hypothetical protein